MQYANSSAGGRQIALEISPFSIPNPFLAKTKASRPELLWAKLLDFGYVRYILIRLTIRCDFYYQIYLGYNIEYRRSYQNSIILLYSSSSSLPVRVYLFAHVFRYASVRMRIFYYSVVIFTYVTGTYILDII